MALTETQISMAGSHVAEKALDTMPRPRYIDAENKVQELYGDQDWTESDVDKVHAAAKKFIDAGSVAMRAYRTKVSDVEKLLGILRTLTHAHK